MCQKKRGVTKPSVFLTPILKEQLSNSRNTGGSFSYFFNLTILVMLFTTTAGRVAVAKPLLSAATVAAAAERGGGGVSSIMSLPGLLDPKFNPRGPAKTNRHHYRVKVIDILTVMRLDEDAQHLDPITRRRLRLCFLPSTSSSSSSSSFSSVLTKTKTKTNTHIESTARFPHPPPEAASHASVTQQDSVFDADDYYGADDFSCFRCLVLDISYRPVNVVCWRRAICLEIMEKADVLEYYDQTVRSPSSSFYIPAVLRVPHLLQVIKRRRIKNTLSRKCILYRDSYMCQYCSSSRDLTIDHVLPIARGGKWTWENLVTACAKCNSRKGQKTLEEANMKLFTIPKVPKDFDKLSIPMTSTALNMLSIRKATPREWHQYL